MNYISAADSASLDVHSIVFLVSS